MSQQPVQRSKFKGQGHTGRIEIRRPGEAVSLNPFGIDHF